MTLTTCELCGAVTECKRDFRPGDEAEGKKPQVWQCKAACKEGCAEPDAQPAPAKKAKKKKRKARK